MITTQVKQLLEAKGHDIWSVHPQETVFNALQIMSDKDVGALVVVENGKLVGIFSERDYARKVILKQRSSKDTTISQLMTRKVFYVELQSTVEDCMALMSSKRIRHLPVMDNGKLVGIVTPGDVVKQIISDQDFTIQQLERYIQGYA